MTVEMLMEYLIWKNGSTSSRVRVQLTAAKAVLENIKKIKDVKTWPPTTPILEVE